MGDAGTPTGVALRGEERYRCGVRFDGWQPERLGGERPPLGAGAAVESDEASRGAGAQRVAT